MELQFHVLESRRSGELQNLLKLENLDSKNSEDLNNLKYFLCRRRLSKILLHFYEVMSFIFCIKSSEWATAINPNQDFILKKFRNIIDL